MTNFSELLRQPLIHFLLIGGAIFALFAAIDDAPSEAMTKEIIITNQMADQLAARFERVRRRRPTARELAGLVDDLIKEEVLAREATALSLDANDTVIRRRLRQKMEFLTSSAVAALKPSDEELSSYFKANAKRYASTVKVAFEQIYLGEAPNANDINTARTSLIAGTYQPPEGAKPLLLLPATLPLSPKIAIDKVFGTGFFDKVEGLDADVWSGAVRSGYGVHLVRVKKRVPARVPPFESVRDAVQRDWLSVKAQEMAEAQYARMLARYSVKRPDLSAVEVER